jgi:tyrosyl-tRNA synthetase
MRRRAGLPADVAALVTGMDARSVRLKLVNVSQIIVEAGLTSSRSEAVRLIKQGAVTLDGKKVDDFNAVVTKGILKVGKRKYLKIV